MDDFRTRVQFPPSPPNTNPKLFLVAWDFLFLTQTPSQLFVHNSGKSRINSCDKNDSFFYIIAHNNFLSAFLTSCLLSTPTTKHLVGPRDRIYKRSWQPSCARVPKSTIDANVGKRPMTTSSMWIGPETKIWIQQRRSLSISTAWKVVPKLTMPSPS